MALGGSVKLELISQMLSLDKKSDPRGLKPAFLAARSGTAEAVPFPKAFVT